MDSKSKKRLWLWAIFIIAIGFVGSMILPEHSVPHFFNLLKDVITSLII